MLAYQFLPGTLSADAQSWGMLTLPTTDRSAILRVRLCPTDAQTLASALAGLSTGASRLAQLVCRIAQRLDATPHYLLLRRNSGNVIEASLVLEAGMEAVEVPLTFGDAMLIAHTARLPVRGDASLSPLVKPVARDEELDPALPPAFATFFQTLE